ncbi:hypothetical protein [Aeromicrobium sp. 179-A 4D2 NHS]|uniref:hypothetical protein n=1 Tax=Aeromicrobium sp. 179-A 4D2 NHS TaxID=3142375 RepID=UPI0039A24043
MRRLSAIAVSSAVLLGTACLVSQAAVASDPAALVHGRVRLTDGTVPAHARVHVFAEPRSADALATGQGFTAVTIGSATTDASGRYAIRYEGGTSLRRLADATGRLSLHVLVESGGRAHASLVQPTVTVPRATALAAAGPDVVASLTDARPAARIRPGRVTRLAARASGPALPTALVSVVRDYGPRRTVVGTWYSDVAGVTQQFRYQRSSRSTLGVAVSSSGRAGTFKAGGTRTESSTAAVGFGTQRGSGGWRFATRFRYQKRVYTYCANGAYCYQQYKIEPTSWVGGASVTRAPAYAATKCVRYAKGTDFTISTSKAWTFSTGVSPSGMTVVDLSSRTGFSSTAKQTIAFTSRGRLCGKRGYPGGSPQALRARPW